MRRRRLLLPILPLLALPRFCAAFVASRRPLPAGRRHEEHDRGTPARGCRGSARRGFFRDMLDRAFENDSSLSRTDKRTGQIDKALTDDDGGGGVGRGRPTETQERWRKAMGDKTSPAPLSVASTSATMDFYLSGVPSKDPSNDLYGSKVNISSRDRRVGLALPDQPTVPSVTISFLEDGTCRCLSDTPFTSASTAGEWRVASPSIGGPAATTTNEVRFRIPVTGYTRTIETRGTIQKVYWSKNDEGDRVLETSTTYTIDPGWIYGEATISSAKGGAGGGEKAAVRWSEGVLKVERATGLLGAATRMVPCGKFVVRSVSGSAGASDPENG
jgi:hypothetical protein